RPGPRVIDFPISGDSRMSNDESPVDVAGTDAAPPGDAAPRGQAEAEPSAATSRRRRTTAAPRASRNLKTTKETKETQENPAADAAETMPVSAVASEPAPADAIPAAAPTKVAARRAPRKTGQKKIVPEL